MTTTLIARSLLGRARTDVGCAAASAHACAPAHVAVSHVAMSPAAVTPTTSMTIAINLWLGGDVQGSGFGSEYATKRIAPGRLEGMT